LGHPTDTTLLTVAEMAEADRLAIAGGVASLTLMENAGRAVADVAAEMVPAGARIAVLCGPGNNGGDGFVAARLLAERGHAVRVACLVPATALRGDAAEMARRWTGPVEAIGRSVVAGAGLVVDALFGAGLTRPIEAELVPQVGGAGVPVLAVDVPSGLDGTTGAVLGGRVIQATRTVTFFRRKPGHLLLPGRLLCGEVTVADIGIPDAVLTTIRPHTFHNAPPLWERVYPRPTLDAHKYTRGHVVAVSGPPFATGAARLGARAALRIGAGLVTVVGTAEATHVNAHHLTAVMTAVVPDAAALTAFLADTRRNSVLIGPAAGVGPETADAVRAVLATPAAVVLDADALTSFTGAAVEGGAVAPRLGFVRGTATPPRPEELFAAIRARTAPVVVTPHEGEFDRLFGILPGLSPDASKLDRARAAAVLSGAVVILKGADTVIAAPDGRAAINDNAPPTLATAGSGDVLAGLVAGLLAQGAPSGGTSTGTMGAWEAACAAVWLHGATATAVGPGLVAEDLPEALPRVLAQMASWGRR
jgi:NAD(P)H-hydrate epimerase